MSSENIHPINLHAIQICRAAQSLEQKNFLGPAIMLLYMLVDHMCWFSIEIERANGDDFKNWVNKYMLVDATAGLSHVTGDDLWAARCGLLHTGAPESNDYRAKESSVRKIYYSLRRPISTTVQDRVIFIEYGCLFKSIIGGTQMFVSELERNKVGDDIARKKVARILNFTQICEY